MTPGAKRKKLHEMVNAATNRQLEVIYPFVEHEMGEAYDHWADEAFVNEIKRRLDELESGKTKGISLEELIPRSQQKLSSRKEKFSLVKEASADPLFLADMNDIANDFSNID